MSVQTKEKTEITKNITEILKGQSDDADNISILARQIVFDSNGQSTLHDTDVSILTQLIAKAFDFLQKRPVNAHKVRAYDIQSNEEHALEPMPLTVIEILNDDMPFLVDSIIGEIQERQLNILDIRHPIFKIQRDVSGQFSHIFDTEAPSEHDADFNKESFIQIITDGLSDDYKRDLVTKLSTILEAVRLSVADWQTMRTRVFKAIKAYENLPPSDNILHLEESISFLNWLLNENFTFLGIRQYDFVDNAHESDLLPAEDSGLGILRDKDIRVLRRKDQEVHLPEEIRDFFFSSDPLIITKANKRSLVHRRAHMDYIGVKIFDENVQICGELRIVGLFTSSAYTQIPNRIPFLRNKVETVIKRYGQSPRSHSSKAILNVLSTFPRDELFQINADLLYDIALGIHNLDLQPRLAVFTRVDEFHRFVSVLVFVPRDNYSTDTRKIIGQYLADALDGDVSAFTPFFPESTLVRIHFIIGRNGGDTPECSNAELEKNIIQLLRSWQDKLKYELIVQYGNQQANTLFEKYGTAFPIGYEASHKPQQTINDIKRLEMLTIDRPIAIHFYECEKANQCRVSIYHLNGPIPLSKRVPILENFGFAVIDERSFRLKPDLFDESTSENNSINLHDMMLSAKDGEDFSLREHQERLEQGFMAVWYQEAEDDPFNQLIFKLGIDWREVAALRALAAYLRQLGVPFTKTYVAETLAKHGQISNTILSIFRARNDPDLKLTYQERQNSTSNLIASADADLSSIASLDEDRILRHFLNLTTSILRTNFYVGKTSSAAERPTTMSFKFDSNAIETMPEPKPFAEIFVYSPRVEGIHLRGGKIARGGLRWSDRRQDFRTEVLGLAKAQQVKNVVIVPTGAKGGFFPKNLSQTTTREEYMAEGVACYKTFISSLLSLTDNVDGDAILKPKDIICHDDDDPYLVVAADKGTAAFSDYANEISQSYNFWMDDAFASGGSAGYDHKKMAITARGAWESVKRHFRELDKDIQSETFRVIGVGDMSGDVFGNGMLLSKTTQLIAAFDHRDIFIDPHPNPDTSWQERKRLFDMARSSWQDYTPSLISSGGGVFSRKAKSIALSEEIQTLTGIQKAHVTPNELIHALLQSETDLLWFGGIGTYIRADNERNEDVGDRANDAIRITASNLKTQAIGEGANLGMTQAARIQFALSGGRVNSDAIDNSAGVNSSDLEVNIKIALGAAMKEGLITKDARNDLLVEMTQHVAAKCLRNNYLQSLTISLGERHGIADMSYQQRLIRELERDELLDRDLEVLPTDAELSERYKQSQPLTRPELAVLLAYAKLDLFDKLIKSTIPDDDFLEGELKAYFPALLNEKFPKFIQNHALRREIIATQLTNAIINRGGSTMSIRLVEETGYPIESISYAFIAARAIFDMEAIFDEIDSLDNKVSGSLQLELYSLVQKLLRQQTVWLLRNVDLTTELSDIIRLYRQGLKDFENVSDVVLDSKLIENLEKKQLNFEIGGVPNSLANHIIGLRKLADVPDIILVAERINDKVENAAQIYGALSKHFEIFTLIEKAYSLDAKDHFERIAINTAVADVATIRKNITQHILQNYQDGAIANENERFEKWLDDHAKTSERIKHNLKEILDAGDFTLAKLTVGVSQLQDLCH
ncbi:MAG: NAD-glutamate dehydrogenase [Pseudomonadota bacterium]